jgi:hypothetical protein
METAAQGRMLPSLREAFYILITFGLTTLAWIFFRAENLGHAMSYISELFSTSIFTFPEIFPKYKIILIVLFLIMEWLGREEQFAIARLVLKWPSSIRYGFYYAIIFIVIWFGDKEQQFIYFQF